MRSSTVVGHHPPNAAATEKAHQQGRTGPLGEQRVARLVEQPTLHARRDRDEVGGQAPELVRDRQDRHYGAAR